MPAADFNISSFPGLASLLHDDNEINYSQGENNGGTWGRVTVDNFEPIEFINKTNLTIESGSGSDQINLNYQNGGQAAPTGLTGTITVDGGNPTGSDRLVINDRFNVPEQLTVRPANEGRGAIVETVAAVGIPQVNYRGMEHLHFVLDPQDADVLQVGGTSGDDRFEYTRGATSDAGTITGEMDILNLGGGGRFHLPEITFAGARTNVFINNDATSQGADPLGSGDRIVYNATNENDTVRINNENVRLISDGVTLTLGAAVSFGGTTNFITVNTGNGDDRVIFDNADDATLQFDVNGGNPDTGSDVLTLNGFGGAQDVEIEPDTSDPTQQNLSGYGANGIAIDATGFELITYRGLGSDDTLNVDLGEGDNTARVERGDDIDGTNSDLITSDSLPNIAFNGLESFTATANQGADTVTFKTWHLLGVNLINGFRDYRIDGSGPDSLIIEGVDGDQRFLGDDRWTVTNPDQGTFPVDPPVQVTDRRGLGAVVTAMNVDLGRLQVDGLGGDDGVTVQVDDIDLIGVPITFDGGAGSDSLIVDGTPATAVTTTTYRPGPDVTEGRLTYDANMTIDFVNLEPVFDFVPADNLVVNGTNAANGFSYTQGDFTGPPANPINVLGLVTGKVAVDGFETIEFAAKETLVLNGLGGSDEFSLNYDNTPSALTGITVNGGDPTSGSDVAIVSGTVGADTIDFAPTSDNDATVTISGLPVVTLDNIEEAILDGQGGPDSLTYTSPAGVDILQFTPGPGNDGSSGSIEGVSDLGGQLMPVSYSDIWRLASPQLAFSDANGNRVDILSILGTDNDNTFTVNSGGLVTTFDVQASSAPSIGTSGVFDLALLGLNGSDTFNVPGNHPFGVMRVLGGNPDNGSDTLNFNGAGADITTDLTDRTIQEFAFTDVIFSGIETANIDAGDAALTTDLTSADDELTYRPTGAEAGTFQNAGDNTTFNFTDVAGDFTVNGEGSVADHLIVEGTNSHDQIAVDSPNRTATVTDATGTALKTVTLADDVETITAMGRDGNDTFWVTPSETVGAVANGNLLITVDGGQPGASDALVVAQADGSTLPASDFAVNSVGLTPGEGRVRVYRSTVAMPDITYINTEIVSPNVVVTAGVPQLLVMGPDPSEPNEYRTNATHLGAGATVNLDNLAIFPNFGEHPGVPADTDFFQIVAETTGTLDVTAHFEIYGALLPGGGDLTINALDSAGNVIAGAGAFGNADGTADARVRFPAVQGQTYFIRVTGTTDDVVNGYELTVTNEAPPVPYDLELRDIPVDGTNNPPGGSANSDTGRSQNDNVTYDNTPTVWFRVDDDKLLLDVPGDFGANNPADENIAIPFNTTQSLTFPAAAVANAGFRVAVYIEGAPQQPGTNPQTPIGYATQVAGTPGVYSFDFGTDAAPGGAALALTDGSHFISARVEMIDPSIDAAANDIGQGLRSASMEIFVDTVAPNVIFGVASSATDGLHPDSDTGDVGRPLTLVDRVTSDTTPTFWGEAEANSIIRAYVDADNSGTLTAADVFIGQTVAEPLDGTNQHSDGSWQLTSTVNMNDPAKLGILGVDGLRRILLTAEDVAGNITAADAVTTIEIFVDTAGPQVTNVSIAAFPAYDLFNLKPNNVTQGPTPRVDALSIDLRDLPTRAAGFLYGAVSNVPPLAPIVLTGDHSGIIPITGVAWNGNPVVAGSQATGSIVLTFASPLPDDRFTLTLNDNIIDPAGNQLDGENNAAEPVGSPFFPTGDQIPGGDFIARFTVDSRPEVAVWSQGVVYADINGNHVWDPEGQDNDATNRDFVYNFGETTDAYFAGNFAPAGAATASGFDKVGAYGAFQGTYTFLLDTNDDGVGDFSSVSAFQVNAIPVAGNFNAAHPGDEIGMFDGQSWYLDVDGDNVIEAGEQFATNLRGIPVVGDFNGDGNDDLATFNNDSGQFQFDLDRNGTVDDVLTFGFTGFGEKPVTGDLNLDGTDDIGLWVPGRDGQLPQEAGEFHFLISDNVAALPSAVFNQFSPAPLGNDIQMQFGDDFALPIIGNFDPPNQDAPEAHIDAHNDPDPLDVNQDGYISAVDALTVINYLNTEGFELTVALTRAFKPDTNGDGAVSSIDALRLVNYLNTDRGAAAEGEFSGQANALEAEAVDNVFGGYFDEFDLKRKSL
ncbi:MAG: dockerin type I domain-containing protein [Planctomycetota bacterium]